MKRLRTAGRTDTKLEFVARCDKFQSDVLLRKMMFASRQVMCFRKRKHDVFRLRRNISGSRLPARSVLLRLTPQRSPPAIRTLRLALYIIKTHKRFPKRFAYAKHIMFAYANASFAQAYITFSRSEKTSLFSLSQSDKLKFEVIR